ncbi:MAG: methyltransferase domain-containing protein [Anaerolineaceae bacterium]|jgi:ubiquinone/menaquinone biosynthesis C-methylase UbiE|nr:methyltransferase domain-containing protein [Anaerolineaceae bacterium]
MKTPPVCDYEGSDYQERFWGAGGRAYEDAAEGMALKRLLPAGGRHLLELGAGAGRNTMRYTGFERVTLLDYSTTQLNQALEKLGSGPRFRYIAADIYRLPFAPSSFDAATMIRTLHHFAQPQLALEQVRGCLADKAVFILEFANKRNFKSVLRYAAGKQKWNPFSREAVEFVELNFDFHPATIRSMLRDNSFRIEKQLSVSYLRADFFKKIFPQKALTGFESFLQSAASWTAYSPSLFLRSRVDGETMPLNTKTMFRCPACGHFPLEDTPPELTCDACGRVYTVKDGIYDFRVDRK